MLLTQNGGRISEQFKICISINSSLSFGSFVTTHSRIVVDLLTYVNDQEKVLRIYNPEVDEFVNIYESEKISSSVHLVLI